MILLSALAHFATAFGLNWLASALGLIPWRRAKEAHWTERARLLWPVCVTVTSNMLLLPIIVNQLHSLLAPEIVNHAILNGLAACAGALFGSHSMSREIHPQLTFRSWLSFTLVGWGFQYTTWFILLGATIYMPSEWNGVLAATVTLYLLFHLAIQFGFVIKYLRYLKRVRPADERLKRIVSETAAPLGVTPRAVWQMIGLEAQAFAYITTKELLFSDALMEICTDEEIATICAHEMAHLTESKNIIAGRIVGSLTLFPLIFINPLVHSFQLTGVLISWGAVWLIQRFSHWLSQRMEKRADQLAVSKQLNEGVYARALEKLYRHNAIPAVNPTDRQTHPHLYDRMIAAGITPDYPRPQKPKKRTWIGTAFFVAMFILFIAMVLKSPSAE